MHRTWTLLIAALLLSLGLTACGGDDDSTDTAGADDAADESGEDDAAADSGGDDAPAASGGGNGGTLVLGDETIALDSARCFLEEQDAAGGGGKILFVGQAFGMNAAGEELVLDVSRFDEDSQFTGDDILVDIGDFETGTSWQAAADLGTVQLSGNTMSADGLTFTNWDDMSEMAGSFEINC